MSSRLKVSLHMGKQYDLHVYSLLVQFCSTASPCLTLCFRPLTPFLLQRIVIESDLFSCTMRGKFPVGEETLPAPFLSVTRTNVELFKAALHASKISNLPRRITAQLTLRAFAIRPLNITLPNDISMREQSARRCRYDLRRFVSRTRQLRKLACSWRRFLPRGSWPLSQQRPRKT